MKNLWLTIKNETMSKVVENFISTFLKASLEAMEKSYPKTHKFVKPVVVATYTVMSFIALPFVAFAVTVKSLWVAFKSRKEKKSA